MNQGERRIYPVFMIILCACLCLVEGVVRAGENEEKTRIAVVVTPRGTENEAAVAVSVVPEAPSERYVLIPASSIDVQAEGDASYAASAEKAQKTAEQAKRAALEFNLVDAAGLWRRASDEINEGITTALDPGQVAGYMMQAGAASADAGEEDLALEYFRRALGIDTDTGADARISPAAQVIFNMAREKGPIQIQPPPDRVLKKLCSLLGVQGVLWISSGRTDDGLSVSRRLVLSNQTESSSVVTHNAPSGESELKEWTVGERDQIAAFISLSLGNGEKETETEWYESWWFYTALGTAVAATAAGLVLGLTMGQEKVDVVVHH